MHIYIYIFYIYTYIYIHVYKLNIYALILEMVWYKTCFMLKVLR